MTLISPNNIVLKGILVALLILASPLNATPAQQKSDGTGIVIILNGPSAAGKSSLQKAIQESFKEPYIALGIDNFFNDIIPDEHGSKVTLKSAPNLYRSLKRFQDKDHKPVVELIIGPEGEKVIQGMHGAIAAYAQAGNNVVVDYIQYKTHWGHDLREKLKGLKVYYIGVEIPLKELEAREAKRATSPSGHARSHYDTVHDGMIYDLTVDTSRLTSKEAAGLVQKVVEK